MNRKKVMETSVHTDKHSDTWIAARLDPFSCLILWQNCKTAMHMAAIGGHEEVIQLLLEAKAAVEPRDKVGV